MTWLETGVIPLLLRRGGCAVNKKSRSHLIPLRRGGRSQATFQNAFRNRTFERPPRPLHQRRLRGILVDVASTLLVRGIRDRNYEYQYLRGELQFGCFATFFRFWHSRP